YLELTPGSVRVARASVKPRDLCNPAPSGRPVRHPERIRQGFRVYFYQPREESMHEGSQPPVPVAWLITSAKKTPARKRRKEARRKTHLKTPTRASRALHAARKTAPAPPWASRTPA